MKPQLIYVKYFHTSNICADGFQKAGKQFHPWLDRVLSKIPVNESINETTLGGRVCAPPGFISGDGTVEDSSKKMGGHIDIYRASK